MKKLELEWNSKHKNVLEQLFNELNNLGIDFFIPRNFEQLPEKNHSQDVDIIVRPSDVYRVTQLVKSYYKGNGFLHYYQEKYHTLNCCFGINVNENISIHIDVIGSFISKGFEVFTFEELYSHTVKFKNFTVLDPDFSGIFLFFSKSFNFNMALKDKYQEILIEDLSNNVLFTEVLCQKVGKGLALKIADDFNRGDFMSVKQYSSDFDRALKTYCYKRAPIKTLFKQFGFWLERGKKVGLFYRRYERSISVMAPDGAGKTTFLNALLDKLAAFNSRRVHQDVATLFHFRPTLIPNLGEIGEKAKVMKQDVDFTNPHRAKPANSLSSFIRLSYYIIDYMLGFNYYIRKDVQYGKFSIFDRYSYDLLVDPLRSRIKLPLFIRKLFVRLTPKPKLAFYLRAPANVIFERKQELTLEEIERQLIEFDNVAKSYKINELDSTKLVSEVVDDAIAIVLEKYFVKL